MNNVVDTVTVYLTVYHTLIVRVNNILTHACVVFLNNNTQAYFFSRYGLCMEFRMYVRINESVRYDMKTLDAF